MSMDHDNVPARRGLIRGSLGTSDIDFMILACAAPMGVLAGVLFFAGLASLALPGRGGGWRRSMSGRMADGWSC